MRVWLSVLELGLQSTADVISPPATRLHFYTGSLPLGQGCLLFLLSSEPKAPVTSLPWPLGPSDAGPLPQSRLARAPRLDAFGPLALGPVSPLLPNTSVPSPTSPFSVPRLPPDTLGLPTPPDASCHKPVPHSSSHGLFRTQT